MTNPETNGYTPKEEKIDLEPRVDDTFEISEQKRIERLTLGLPPRGELDVSINHAEYLVGTGHTEGKRILEAALAKKRAFFERKGIAEHRPPTQTQPQREKI